MNQVMAGRPLTVFGDGLQTRAFTHIDDVAPLIARSRSRLPETAQTWSSSMSRADTPYTVVDLAGAVFIAF